MKRIFAIFLLSMSFISCNSVFAGVNKSSALERHEKQFAYYDTDNPVKVMQAVVSTLHDSGFMVQEVDYDLGFIRARKSFKESFTDKKRVLGWSTVLAATTAYSVFSYGSTAGMMIEPTKRVGLELRDKTVVADVNVNIQNLGKRTKVRLSIVEKVLQNADGHSFTKSAPIKVLHPDKDFIYNEFFEQVENNLVCGVE